MGVSLLDEKDVNLWFGECEPVANEEVHLRKMDAIPLLSARRV